MDSTAPVSTVSLATVFPLGAIVLGALSNSKQQAIQQLIKSLGAERRERELAVEGLPHPFGSELGPEVGNHERPRSRNGLDQRGKELLARGVDPVQVLDEVDEHPILSP